MNISFICSKIRKILRNTNSLKKEHEHLRKEMQYSLILLHFYHKPFVGKLFSSKRISEERNAGGSSLKRRETGRENMRKYNKRKWEIEIKICPMGSNQNSVFYRNKRFTWKYCCFWRFKTEKEWNREMEKWKVVRSFFRASISWIYKNLRV